MAGLQVLSSGPSRAVVVLSVTQVLGWGVLFYPPAHTMTHIAADHGWSLAQALAGLSIALGVSGVCAPLACGLIDRHGGNLVMAFGALIGALGLLILPLRINTGFIFSAGCCSASRWRRSSMIRHSPP